MTKAYRYVLVTDDGRAPCIDNDLVTLGTCKPVIRRCASVGDWVMGFYPSSAPYGTLAWVGRVDSKLSHDEYERVHRGRSDAVYRIGDQGRYQSLEPDYHPDSTQKQRDYNNPVLIFGTGHTWYFGDSPEALPEELLHLTPSGQGHRVNGRRNGDLGDLIKWLERKSAVGIIGKPRHASESAFGFKACGSSSRRHGRSRCQTKN
ncbi:MAG: hypothetical protein AAFR64_11170 [Pseudomonadota bacterium]